MRYECPRSMTHRDGNHGESELCWTSYFTCVVFALSNSIWEGSDPCSLLKAFARLSSGPESLAGMPGVLLRALQTAACRSAGSFLSPVPGTASVSCSCVCVCPRASEPEREEERESWAAPSSVVLKGASEGLWGWGWGAGPPAPPRQRPLVSPGLGVPAEGGCHPRLPWRNLPTHLHPPLAAVFQEGSSGRAVQVRVPPLPRPQQVLPSPASSLSGTEGRKTPS